MLLVLLSKSLSSSWCLVAHPLLEAHLLKPIAPIWTQSIRASLFSNQELVQAGKIQQDKNSRVKRRGRESLGIAIVSAH